jgi:hypothetical protein
MPNLEEILNMIQNHGIFTTILFLVGIGFWGLMKTAWFSDLVSKFGDALIGKLFKKKKHNDLVAITEVEIINHDIFNYIDLWQFSIIPTLNFSTDYRTVVFRKYLKIYLQKHKENLSKFITDAKYKDMPESELWKSFLQLINDIIHDYEKEMSHQGIPDVIIEKMKVKNNDTLSLTIDLIEGICNSQFYGSENNLLKVYSILNIMLSILENTVSGSANVCNSINGQLAGLEMDGRKEPDSNH